MTTSNSKPPHGWYAFTKRLLRICIGCIASAIAAASTARCVVLAWGDGQTGDIVISATIALVSIALAFLVTRPDSHVTEARGKSFRFRTGPRKRRQSSPVELPSKPSKRKLYIDLNEKGKPRKSKD